MDESRVGGQVDECEGSNVDFKGGLLPKNVRQCALEHENM